MGIRKLRHFVDRQKFLEPYKIKAWMLALGGQVYQVRVHGKHAYVFGRDECTGFEGYCAFTATPKGAEQWLRNKLRKEKHMARVKGMFEECCEALLAAQAVKTQEEAAQVTDAALNAAKEGEK